MTFEWSKTPLQNQILVTLAVQALTHRQGDAVNAAKNWTIAYRNPRANSFKRVTNWSGTWSDAATMCGLFSEMHPDMEIWYVPTRESEDAGIGHAEDFGNIIVASGKRVRMFETGTLPDELVNVTIMEPIPATPIETGFRFRKHGTWSVVGGCKSHAQCVLMENNWNGMVLTEHMTREELENNFTMRPESEKAESFTRWIVTRVSVSDGATVFDRAMSSVESAVVGARSISFLTLQRMLRAEIHGWADMGMDYKREELLFTDTLDYPNRNRFERDGVRWTIRGW